MPNYLNALANAQETIRGGIRNDRLLENRLAALRMQREEQRRANELSQAVGGRLAANDLPGARTAAYEGGALDVGAKIDAHMQDMNAADRKQFMEGIGIAANLVDRGLKGPELGNALTGLGFDAEDVQGILSTPPQALLAARDYLKGSAGGQGFTLSPGQTRFGPGGERIAGVPAAPATANAKPTYGVISEDQYGNKVYGYRYPDGRVVPYQAPETAPQGQPQAQPGLTGDAFLRTLDPRMAAQVKALDEGRLKPPTGRALKTAYWRELLANTAQYDPDFDFNSYQTRRSTYKAFTSGPEARNITSYNTALQHLEKLTEAYKGLGNFGSSDINWLAGFASRRGLDPSFVKSAGAFDLAKKAVADELARAFAGPGGSTVADREAWENKFAAYSSPGQFKAAVSEAVGLLEGRIDALAKQYNNGMNAGRQPLDFLSPKAREAYNAVTQWASGQNTEQPATTPETAPPPAQPQIPDKAIRFLMQNPGTAEQFDAKYGHGAAQRYLRGR